MKKDNFFTKLVNMLPEEKETKYEKIYYRPSKERCIIGLVISFIFLILLVLTIGIGLNIIHFILYGIDLFAIVYYSLNLFTVKGFILPKHVKVEEEEEDEKYKVQ